MWQQVYVNACGVVLYHLEVVTQTNVMMENQFAGKCACLPQTVKCTLFLRETWEPTILSHSTGCTTAVHFALHNVLLQTMKIQPGISF